MFLLGKPCLSVGCSWVLFIRPFTIYSLLYIMVYETFILMFLLSLMGYRVELKTIKVQKRRNSEVLRRTLCPSGIIWYQSAKMDLCLINYCLTSAWTMLLLCHGSYSHHLSFGF